MGRSYRGCAEGSHRYKVRGEVKEAYGMYHRHGTYTEVPFEELLGKTITKGVIMKVYDGNEDSVTFETTDGETYVMYHEQDCCESVNIEGIIGGLDDLI